MDKNVQAEYIADLVKAFKEAMKDENYTENELFGEYMSYDNYEKIVRVFYNDKFTDHYSGILDIDRTGEDGVDFTITTYKKVEDENGNKLPKGYVIEIITSLERFGFNNVEDFINFIVEVEDEATSLKLVKFK